MINVKIRVGRYDMGSDKCGETSVSRFLEYIWIKGV